MLKCMALRFISVLYDIGMYSFSAENGKQINSKRLNFPPPVCWVYVACWMKFHISFDDWNSISRIKALIHVGVEHKEKYVDNRILCGILILLYVNTYVVSGTETEKDIYMQFTHHPWVILYKAYNI